MLTWVLAKHFPIINDLCNSFEHIWIGTLTGFSPTCSFSHSFLCLFEVFYADFRFYYWISICLAVELLKLVLHQFYIGTDILADDILLLLTFSLFYFSMLFSLLSLLRIIENSNVCYIVVAFIYSRKKNLIISVFILYCVHVAHTKWSLLLKWHRLLSLSESSTLYFSVFSKAPNREHQNWHLIHYINSVWFLAQT